MDLTDIAMYCKIKQSEREADKYKQQSDLYESVLTGTVTEFVVPSEWTEIRGSMFYSCTNLVNVTIPNSVEIIRGYVFTNCTSLINVTIPNNVKSIGGYMFNGCTSLVSVTIPNSVRFIGGYMFNGCTNLTSVTLGDGFNCNGLDLSPSTKYSVDTLVAMLTALADRTGQTAYTLTLGTTNLAKLSDAQKAIATDKNWTLA